GQAPVAGSVRAPAAPPASAPGSAAAAPVPVPRPAPPAAPAGTDPAAGAGIPGRGHSAPASPLASAPGTSPPAAAPASVPAPPRAATAGRSRHRLPPATGRAYLTSAKVPLVRGEPLYADVASQTGIPWEILAACDWMQCKAKAGLSPVYGEKLGTANPDGT